MNDIVNALTVGDLVKVNSLSVFKIQEIVETVTGSVILSGKGVGNVSVSVPVSTVQEFVVWE